MYDRVKDEPEFTNMLGQSGSSPLDLFMDAVDDMGVVYQQEKERIAVLLKDLKSLLTDEPTYTLAQFKADLQKLNQAVALKDPHPSSLYSYYQEARNHLEEVQRESKRREKKLKHKRIDHFKSLLKYYHPPISSEATWDQVRTHRVEHLIVY